jgi:transcriptional regulator with XRE-family HTH domain
MDKNLKELRKMASLTQFELAQRCSISRMRLSLAECEQIQLYPEELANVQKILLAAIEDRDVQLRGVLSAGSSVAASA